MKSNKKLIVFGAGGHGRVIADIAVHAGWDVAGFVDDRVPCREAAERAVPILGNRSWLREQDRGEFEIALGIGDNYIRKSVSDYLDSGRFQMATIISASAVVSPSARIGPGVVIMPCVVINAMAEIGTGAIINSGAVVEHDVKVGDYAHISPNAAMGGGAEAGEFSHIGLGASVLPLVQVGSRSILGAGAVAVRAIPDDVVALGVPAKVVRSIYPAQKTLFIQTA